jgi:hypothetical protein
MEEGSSTDYVIYISLPDLQKLYLVVTTKELSLHCYESQGTSDKVADPVNNWSDTGG